MADSFFGFDTDFPSGLNVLGPRGGNDELLTDDEEEEYDALNAETFGHAQKDDWEEAHEKLSELVKPNDTTSSIFNDSLLEGCEYQNEILSKSISQLGLEDDLDDPAIMTLSRNRNPMFVEKYFNKPSGNFRYSSSPPPPAFLETETCGSPKTHSIWSTTPNDSGIGSLLKSISHTSNSPSLENSTPLKTGSDSVFTSPLRSVWTAEELEKELTTPNKPYPTLFPRFTPPYRNAPPPMFLGKVPSVFPSPPIRPPIYPIMRPPNVSNGPIQPGNMLPMRPGRGPVIGPDGHPFYPYGSLHGLNNIIPSQVPLRAQNLPPGFHRRNFQQPMVFHNRLYNGEGSPVDEYAGLMTQQEKEWLIKIQMLLLKSENPYVEDYYYTTQVTRACKKKFSESAQNGAGDGPELILPERSKPESKTYVPLQFEGSLGKLQAVSVNFPRKVLDASVTRPSDEVSLDRSLLEYRRLLVDIEKLYSLLLQVDDQERRILALPEGAAADLHEAVARLTRTLFQRLSGDTLPDILDVRKGRNLFVRAFRLFSGEQQLRCLARLFHNLSAVLRADQQDGVLLRHASLLLAALEKALLPDLVSLGEALSSHFPRALKTAFGASIVCTLLQQAERLYAGYELFESDMQVRWSKIVLHVVDCLCSSPTLSSPIVSCDSLLPHFQRFAIDRDKFDLLQEKLKKLESNCSEEGKV